MLSEKPYVFKALYECILESGYSPYLMVDITVKDVIVPIEFADGDMIVLNMKPWSINNLLIDQEGISFQARFSGNVRNIFVPFSAVIRLYAHETAEGFIFNEHGYIDEKYEYILVDDGSEEAASTVVVQDIKDQTEKKPKDAGKSHLTLVK